MSNRNRSSAIMIENYDLHNNSMSEISTDQQSDLKHENKKICLVY